jgi:hypothetical protein
MLKGVSLEVLAPYCFYNFDDLIFGRTLLTSRITFGPERGEAGRSTPFCRVRLYWFDFLLNILFLDDSSLQNEVKLTTVI